MTVGRRHAAVVLATTVLVVSGTPGAAAHAEAEEAACPVVAAAQGVQVMVSKSDDLFLQAPSGLAVPAAQACVDYGVSDSTGFASNPYPGETVRTLPGLLAGVTGAPIPEYPAYASSTFPSRENAKVEQPGYSLSASSTATSSRARASMGADEDAASAGTTLVTAEATVDARRRTSSSIAIARSEPAAINDVLMLSRVDSLASAAIDASGALVRGSELRIGRTEVAGQAVEITPDGVRAADQTVPLPDGNPAEVLAAAGVHVRYLHEQQTERGVLSAGIEVVAQQRIEGALVTVHYVFGRAFAAADVVDVPATGGTVPEGGSPTDMGSEAGTPGEHTGELQAPDAPSSGPVPAGPAPEAAELPAEAADPPVLTAPQRVDMAAAPAELGIAGLYLVITFGALAVFVCGTLLRLLGVKTRWTS